MITNIFVFIYNLLLTAECDDGERIGQEKTQIFPNN
jgi:hypothetical protein